MSIRLTCAVLACVALTACTGRAFIHDWNERYIQAARAHDEGRLDDAEGHYVQLLKHAPDDETRRLAMLRLARLAEDRGRVDEARSAYRALYAADPADLHGAHAMYREVELTFEADGDFDAALELCRALIARYPDYLPAEHCVDDVERYHRTAENLPALARELESMATALADTELGDFLLYRLGRLYAEEMDRPDDAVAVFDRLYELDPVGPLYDDALWYAAQVRVEQERWQDALGYYQRLLDAREESWWIGSYDSEWVDDARFSRGRIYFERLEDYDRAAQEFAAYVDEFEDNLEQDDAAWWRVHALRRGGGDWKGAARELIERFPESRFAPRAQRMIDGEEVPL